LKQLIAERNQADLGASGLGRLVLSSPTPTSVSVAEDVAVALRHHMEERESDEAKEGIAAFLEKRPPKWAG
jgi:enoyl-CoA hydratase/carnithine racemase